MPLRIFRKCTNIQTLYILILNKRIKLLYIH